MGYGPGIRPTSDQVVGRQERTDRAQTHSLNVNPDVDNLIFHRAGTVVSRISTSVSLNIATSSTPDLLPAGKSRIRCVALDKVRVFAVPVQ